MKKLFIYLLSAMLCTAMAGCLDDDNNYNYNNINDLGKGGIGNMKNDYSVIVGEELTITPTFQFTIDKENPDVSYRWYLDEQLIAEATEASYTFCSEKSGSFLLTYSVVDNKTGVAFSKSTKIAVRSKYQRGWLLLSNDNGRSVLHFILPTTTQYEKNAISYEGEETTIIRDSIVYHEVMRDIVPNLGTNPIGLMEHFAADEDEKILSSYDEVIVKQDRWAELHGNTLEHELFLDEEFSNDLPEGFHPREACFTCTAKAIMDNNGLIYWMPKSDIADFHSGFFTSIGVNNNTVFSHLFESVKFNIDNTACVLALRQEDNSFVVLADDARWDKYGSDTGLYPTSIGNSGNMYEIDDSNESGNRFQNLDKEVIEAIPAAWGGSSFGYDYTSAISGWTVLVREPNTNNYQLRFFTLDFNRKVAECTYYCEQNLGTLSDYKGMAVCQNNQCAIIADGNQLYYLQYANLSANQEIQAQKIALGDAFKAPIKAIEAADIESSDSYLYNAPYGDQIGVTLEDGSFYILHITETKDSNKVTTAVEAKQVFPNETVTDGNFGTVVDVLYKAGRLSTLMRYPF